MENFKYWLKKNKIDTTGGIYQSFPINHDYRGYKFKNIFLAGDAGGFASGLTGEGIYQAFVSGEEVAKLILDPEYKPKKIEKLLRIKKRHDFLLKVFTKYKRSQIILFYVGKTFSKVPCLRKRILKMVA